MAELLTVFSNPSHFEDKFLAIRSYKNKYNTDTQVFIAWFMELSTRNKRLVIEWIELNYSYTNVPDRKEESGDPSQV